MYSKFKAHFSAIVFRRWTLIKRSVSSILLSIIGTIIYSSLAIVASYLMKTLIDDQSSYVRFGNERISTSDIAVSYSENNQDGLKFANILVNLYTNDTGLDAKLHNFTSRDNMNSWLLNISEKWLEPEYVNLALSFDDEKTTNESEKISHQILTATNSSGSQLVSQLSAQIHATRAIWKLYLGEKNDFEIEFSMMLGKTMDTVIGYLSPMLIACGILSIVPLLITQPILDINGEVRTYMIGCTLTLFLYWTATFVIDLILWTITTLLVWILFVACQIQAFLDNLLTTWYSLFLTGTSFILFAYVLSFMFSSAETASRQAFLILVVILLLPMIISIARDGDIPIWLYWIYALFPPDTIYSVFTFVLVRIGLAKQTLDFYFEDEKSQPYYIMQFANILIYALILFIIEKVRLHLQARSTKRTFGNYGDFFKKQKAKHPVTDEAHEMEKFVADSHDFAVRIQNVSRLFFNTAGKPISAVNCVSLGVKSGSTFGFLGANGAGKTTLIKMITSMLPPSDGTIEINGVVISEFNDPTLLSVCPQFNSHLCQEMTPFEHFYIYSKLFMIEADEASKTFERLLTVLELGEVLNKPIRDLSDGEVRKLSIALSFFGPAQIILLDEPTASLDPVARHHVHEMIAELKGQKTFMLCTHLLSEAESLCDNISIMIKGCVYTCGSPQYLSSTFGTEFKIDVGLPDEDDDIQNKCTDFFQQQLPTAELSMLRPKARIYSIPANSITLPELFTKMEHGKQGSNGFDYYTCNTSSLERVFMEISEPIMKVLLLKLKNLKFKMNLN
jgi:ABC-type multidrug transport system ATPase subunit